MLLTYAMLVLMTLLDGPTVGPAEFARLMQGLHGDVHDVSFVYEGWTRGVPPGSSVEEDIKSGPAHRVWEVNYQGGYSFRADGATRLDRYVDYTMDGKKHKSFSSHDVKVIFKSKMHSVSLAPGERDGTPMLGGGGAGVLNGPFSPERIHYSWFFRTLRDPAKKGYKFMGWEDVDGHRCLKVQFDATWGLPEQMEDRPVIRFWIDMKRGGHPLQIEFLSGERPRMRVARIELQQVADSDVERWFPVSGVMYEYPFLASEYTGRAVGYEAYQVLHGTVRFNQDLPDAFFSLDWKGSIPETKQSATRRKEFRKPLRRYDPEGIRQHLAEELDEAEKQSRQLEASSPAREPWNWTMLGQACFALVGAATLLTAGVRRWISR